MTTPQHYTTQQAADLLGVDPRTIRRHAGSQGIAKLGRDYLLTAAQVETIRQSIAEARPGNPAWRKG